MSIEYLTSVSQGVKVRDKATGKVYDFGYWSATEGMAVVYKEGERNGQDSIAIPCAELDIMGYEDTLKHLKSQQNTRIIIQPMTQEEYDKCHRQEAEMAAEGFDVAGYLECLAKADLEVFLYVNRVGFCPQCKTEWDNFPGGKASDYDCLDCIVKLREIENFSLTIETTDGIIGTGSTITEACEDHFMASQQED